MYDYNYGSGMTDTSGLLGIFGALGAVMVVISIVASVAGLISLISTWMIYKKAGKPGWASIVPIYNTIVLLQIVELPIWYIILFMVPFANIYVMFKIYIELAHKFGKSTGFGVACVFFGIICLPMLAFGKNNVYVGSNTSSMQVNNMQQPANQPNVNAPQNINNNMNNGVPFPSSTPVGAAMFEQNVNTQISPIGENNMQTPPVEQPTNNIIPNPTNTVVQNPQTSMPEQNIAPVVNDNVNIVPNNEPTPFVYNPNPTPTPVEQPFTFCTF